MSGGAREMATRSCTRCAIRKTKCDKQQPSCSSCSKLRAECDYPDTSTPRRKRKRMDTEDSLTSRGEKVIPSNNVKLAPSQRSPAHDMLAVSHLAVSHSKGEPKAQVAAPEPHSVHSTIHPLGSRSQPRLLQYQDRSKYLDNGLWTRVVDELAEPGDALEDLADESDEESEIPQDDINFVLGLTPAPIKLTSLHPSGALVLEMWQAFSTNVDPLTKIVHCPTLSRIVQKAASDTSSIPKPLSALLFSIYSAAIGSLRDEDCITRFGGSRSSLLTYYRNATKAALSQANFTGSANLVLLQAFLIHILSMREVYDSRTLWTLTGLAQRIAESMGLHRDGVHLKLPRFETEIRRRIWWQLKLIDGDVAELCGADKFGAFDNDPRATIHPSNVDDDELYPGCSNSLKTQDRATDMIFCSLRFDLRSYWTTNFVQKRQHENPQSLQHDHASSTSIEERDRAVDDFEKTIESKYVRFCDPSQPIQLMATLAARTGVSTARLIAHHPRRWATREEIPPSERLHIWQLSLKGLRQYNMLLTSVELMGFRWHAPNYFRWQTLIIILDTLTAEPLIKDSDQAWHLIDQVYEKNPDFVKNIRRPLYVAVGNLCIKAFNARTQALAAASQAVPTMPHYLKTLVQQRQEAAARRLGRGRPVKGGHYTDINLSHKAQSYTPGSQDRLHKSQLQTSPQLQHADLQQPKLDKADSMFRDCDLPADDIYDFSNNSVRFDPDIMLAADTFVEDPLNQMNQTIDWDEWDTLMRDFT